MKAMERLAYIAMCAAIAAVSPVLSAAEQAVTARLDKYNGNIVYPWLTAPWENNYVPTNANDVISLYGTGGDKLMLTIPAEANFAIDSIVDSPVNTYLRFVSGKSYSRIAVRQMRGYLSNWPISFYDSQNWKVNNPYSGFIFTGDKAEPTEVCSYYLGTLPYFSVPAADGAARINRMMHMGAFVKEGAGDLTVAGPVGPDSVAIVSGGSFGVDAVAETTDESPAPDAFCHVDASSNVYSYYDEVSGRTYVTNWADARLNGFSAFNNNWKDGALLIGCPHISSKTVNGRRLIDFGKYRTRTEEPGDDSPSGALLWSSMASNIREVFMVVEMKEDRGATADVAPIGYTSGTCPFLMYSTANHIFKQDSVVFSADVRVNGSPILPQHDLSDPFQIRVISCKVTSDCRGNTFGKQASNGRGGFLLGEALVYTNELTEAERRRTIAYLKKRWIDEVKYPIERADWDFGDVTLSNAAISVETERTARIRRVQDTCAALGVESGGIVKKGAGTLMVDKVVPSDASIVVEEGSVVFTKVSPGLFGTSLPQGPLINFDAESSAFEYDNGSDTDITAWRSLVNSSKFIATNLVKGATRTQCPKRVPSATPTGLHAVDFLDNAISANAASLYNPQYKFPDAPVYNAFIVWKNKYDKYYRAAHFCDSLNLMVKRASKGQLLDYKNNSAFGSIAGMNWRVNGLAVNPLDKTFEAMNGDTTVDKSDWVLISFDSPVPVSLNGMARTMEDTSGGGCLVAALVGYDRPLADHERREAEAYLMKRFLGKNHPDEGNWSGDLKFGEGVVNSIDNEADISPSSVIFSSTSFVKSGSGKMSIGKSVSSLSSLAVEGGEVDCVLDADLCADAFARFDASDLSSFEWDENGDGTFSISKWHDVRRNGLCAAADSQHCYAKPRYTTAATDGLLPGLGYVDFGPTSISQSDHATNVNSAAMLWNKRAESVREVHIVYADADYAIDNNKVGNPVSYVAGNNQSGFIRQYKKYILYNKFENMLCDTELDGVSVAQTALKPDGFGVVSFVVTNHLNDTLLLGRIDSFCNERNTVYGGTKIAEVIVFEKEQTPERRKAIDDMLLKKWCGIGAGVQIGVPDVAIAAGARLNVAVHGNDAALALSRIDVSWDGTSAGVFTVAGAVDAAKPATVYLNFDRSPRFAVSGKSVKILEASGILNPSGISSWNLVLPESSGHTAKLKVSGNAVYVVFDCKGTIMLVK